MGCMCVCVDMQKISCTTSKNMVKRATRKAIR